jgi:hypothetical protein
VLETARRALAATPPAAERWLFRYWDAPWIAAQTDLSAPAADVPLLEVDLDVGRPCAMEDEAYLSVQPMSGHYASLDLRFQALGTFDAEAHARTEADRRFLAGLDEVGACLVGKGFQVQDSSLGGGVKFEDSWGEEESLKAVLAEATCSNDLGFTQQAADSEATYQQQLIDAHEAELLAIRAEAATLAGAAGGPVRAPAGRRSTVAS